MEFIIVVATVQSYLVKWGERLNFGDTIAEIVRKSMREKKVEWCDWEREKKWILVMILPKFIPLTNLCPWSAPVGVAEWFTNCGNQVTEIVGNWGERKYELWQLSCRKREGKKSGCQNLGRN